MSDETVLPGEPWTGVVRAGQRLRIVDLEGLQAVDTLCYDAHDYANRYSAANTIRTQRRLFLTTGSVLMSTDGDALATIVDDTCGRHDTVGGACSAESNTCRFGHDKRYMHNCRDNFLTGLARVGMGKRDLAPNINFFMNVPVTDDGLLDIVDGISQPGAYVELRADRDTLVRDLQLPAAQQPVQRLEPDADPGGRMGRVKPRSSSRTAARSWCASCRPCAGWASSRSRSTRTPTGTRRTSTLADDAVHLGPAPPAQSYLDGERLLDAASRSGADAVHPGYGFVSEDPAFARACEAGGLVWIGPAPEHIEQFGRKDAARALAREAGVPLLAGTDVLRDVEAATAAAARIGYPVMLKSRAGGGGIGMQRCDTEADLSDAFERVTRLAGLHFGDPAVLPRAVSSRRRATSRCRSSATVRARSWRSGSATARSSGVTRSSSRRRQHPRSSNRPAGALADAAVALGRASGYRSAGTVEFVLDPHTQEFAFLEVNARLQVEHPVTEAVTGIDLVEWMVRLADGSLPPLLTAWEGVRPRPARPSKYGCTRRIPQTSSGRRVASSPSGSRPPMHASTRGSHAAPR